MTQASLVRQQLLTPEEVSTLLRVPTTTLAVWRSTGRVKLRFVKIGRLVRYLASDIEAYIASALQAA
jgi:excisionase family DNA binding protein